MYNVINESNQKCKKMLKESQLRNCAAELNEVFGLKPPIDIRVDLESLKATLLKAITYRQAVDIFTPEVLSTIEELELLGEATEIEKETAEVTEDELLMQVKSSMKLKDLKNVAVANVEFKIIRSFLDSYKNVEDLRSRMMDILFELNPPVVKTEAEIEPKEEEIIPDPEAEAPRKLKDSHPVTPPFDLKVNPAFKAACPALTDEEYKSLEDLICEDGIVIQPIIRWGEFIVDGHNRYEIATRHGIPFSVDEKVFGSENEALVWIKENALSQRNLPDYAKFEMMKELESILIEMGKKKKGDSRKAGPKVDTSTEKFSTRKELSKKSGVSVAQIKKAKVIDKVADEETKEKLRTGKTTIGKEYEKVKDAKPISDHEKLMIGSHELDKWIIKYGENPFLKDTDIISRLTDISIEISEIPSF